MTLDAVFAALKFLGCGAVLAWLANIIYQNKKVKEENDGLKVSIQEQEAKSAAEKLSDTDLDADIRNRIGKS